MWNIRKTHLMVAALVVLVAVVSLQWCALARKAGFPEGLIQANGRIEGDAVLVSSKFAGRVQRLHSREGDAVRAGQMMAELDDVQTRARVDQARQGLAALEAQVEAAHTQLAILNLEVPLSIETAQAQVDRMTALMQKAIAQEKDARSDLQRVRTLSERDNATRQQLDQAEARWHVAWNEVGAARSAFVSSMKELTQAELGWKRIRAKEAEVAALERQRDQADAGLAEIQSVLNDLTIVAPADGIVTTRFVSAGEFMISGAPLFELVDLDRLYLKVYVPEVQIGKVRRGLPVRVYVDAFPDSPFQAVVRHIAARAEFTPKEVQTADERVKLVYAVRLYFDENPGHQLTPGLPADAVIRWREDVAWRKPRW